MIYIGQNDGWDWFGDLRNGLVLNESLSNPTQRGKSMKINSYLVRISAGKAPIDKPLEIGSEVVIGARGTVTKIEDSDNQDGSYDRTYVIKIAFAEDYSVKEGE